MSLIASAKGGDFVNAPAGVHLGVCVDVVDMGMVDNGFGPKHVCRIVFQLETRMEDNRRFIANRRFNITLSEKSNLLPFLQNWRGRPFTDDELKGFDLESLIGANGNVQILHEESKGQTYANITAVFPMMQGQNKLVNEGYVRVKDRDKQSTPQRANIQTQPAQPPKPHPSTWPQTAANSDDVPFVWIIGAFALTGILSHILSTNIFT